MSVWKFRRGCRDDTGVFQSENRGNVGDDLSSASGDGRSSRLLGSMGLTECRIGSSGQIGLRRHARRRRGIT